MDYYTAIAEGYNQLHEQEQLAKLNILLQHVRFSGAILDVGAGTCVVARHLSQYATCISTDPSETMLQKGIGERYVAMAERLPFADTTFDGVVSLTALHHCDIAKALHEIKRVAKPDAPIAISFLRHSPQLKIFEEIFKHFFSPYKKIDANQDILFISQQSIKQAK